MDQQEPRRVLVGGRVTDRRGFEKDPAICVRRRSEKFFRDVIPWARQQVMLPLRQHVVNTVEADHRFDLGGYRDMGIGPIFAGKCWLLARERNQSRKVGAGAVADHSDTLGIDPELACIGSDILHRRLGVVDRARIGLHVRLHQTVFDCEHGEAVLGEIGPPVRIELAVAHLPSTAVDGDQHRRLVEVLRRVKIAQ